MVYGDWWCIGRAADQYIVVTGQGKVREFQGQGTVREFCAGSGKFEILRKVREIQENPLKVGEI